MASVKRIYRYYKQVGGLGGIKWGVRPCTRARPPPPSSHVALHPLAAAPVPPHAPDAAPPTPRVARAVQLPNHRDGGLVPQRGRDPGAGGVRLRVGRGLVGRAGGARRAAQGAPARWLVSRPRWQGQAAGPAAEPSGPPSALPSCLTSPCTAPAPPHPRTQLRQHHHRAAAAQGAGGVHRPAALQAVAKHGARCRPAA